MTPNDALQRFVDKFERFADRIARLMIERPVATCRLLGSNARIMYSGAQPNAVSGVAQPQLLAASPNRSLCSLSGTASHCDTRLPLRLSAVQPAPPNRSRQQARWRSGKFINCIGFQNRIATTPARSSAADIQHHTPERSRRTNVEISIANSTLVSRRAATSATCALVNAQIAIQ